MMPMFVDWIPAMIRIPHSGDQANNELRRSALLGLGMREQEGRGLLGNDWWNGGARAGRAAGAEECECGGPSRTGVQSLTRRLPEATSRP